MYALVMWIGDEPTTSVVLLKDVEFSGKKTRAKWGPNYWPVQILRESADKEWLESLSVIANGQVIWSRPKQEQNGPAPKKQKLNDDKNEMKMKNIEKKVSRMSDNKKNVNTSKNSSDDESEKNNSDDETANNDEKIKNKSVDENRKIENDEEASKNESDDETMKIFTDEEIMNDDSNEDNDSDDSNSDDCSDFDDSNNTRKQKINKVESEPLIGPFHCGLDSTILTSEVVNFFKELAAQMEKMLEAKEIFSGTRRLLGMCELIPGSGVMISNSDIFEIKSTCTTNPKEMTRRLIRSIINKEELINMTPKGRGSRQAIPKNIFTAVETFVKENTLPNFQLTHAEYSRCLTQMCSTLRNTKLSTNESSKMETALLTDQYRCRLRSSSNKRDDETSQKHESSKERPKLAARKRPTASCEATKKYKRIIQRKN